MADIFAACVGNIIDNEEACRDGADPEGVHQMRVSLRRLRSSLKVFGAFLDARRVDWMAGDLKWLGNQLGPARDWDVYIGETLASVAAYGIDDKAIAAMTKAAAARRAKAYAQVRAALGSERYARLVFRLTAFVQTQGWLPRPVDADDPLLKPLGMIAPKALHKPYRKLMAEARHEVRIRLKRVRYGVDFLRGVYPGARTEKFMKALKELRDQFGHLNDVAQAMRLTDELTTSINGTRIDDLLLFAGGQVRGWYARALQDAEPQLLRDWQEFAAAPPFWEEPA